MQSCWMYIFFFVGLFTQTSLLYAGFSFGSKESGINLVGGKLSISNAVQNWDGTLTTSSERNLTSGQINFSSGRLLVNNVPSLISGRLQAEVARRLQLLGSQVMRVDTGPLPARVYVSGTNNRFEGQPIFNNDTVSDPNIYLDSGAELTLAMQSMCNGFISLNNAALTLDDHLAFTDGKEILGTGNVYVNTKTISFGGTDLVMTGTLAFVGPAAIAFNSGARLSSKWIVGSTDLSKHVNIMGNGNTLDLSLGGTIHINPGVKVALSHVKIKGFGGTGSGGIAFGSTSSELRLSNVQLELDGNYTVTMGTIYVDGPATIVTKNKTLTFSQKGTLSVDGITLWYDTAGYDDGQNIKPTLAFSTNGSTANFGLLNGGTIRRAEGTSSGSVSLTAPAGSSSVSTTLGNDLGLTATKKLVVTDNAVVNGGGRVVSFSNDDNIIDLAANKRVTFNNVILQGFSPQHMRYTNDRSIMFSDNVTIQLSPTKNDVSRGAMVLDGRWFFGGSSNMILDGGGNTLDISSNIAAMSLVSTGTLTIQNMKLYGLGSVGGYSNLRILNRHGTINFKNVELILTGDYTHNRGYLNIYQDVLIRGVGRKFVYKSEYPLTITDSAILSLDYGFTFSYDTRDNGGLKNQHLKFASDTSTLHLDGATLHATRVGLQIPRGTIFANNKVTFSSEGQTLEESFVVASRVNVHVLGAATLSLDGKVILE
ncbi:hypothetical protein FJ364_00080 [Candidatus Dependentiae bacterium]|nr:hypothetical protein [Candidatus Dependentiae bacterium]